MYIKKKAVFLILFFSILLLQFNSTLRYVFAASSPWTQTDWSGGSGQTNWSDNTKFDSGTNVTTSTAGQVTLEETSNWYNSSWSARRKITFDNSAQAENLTDFTVLVKLDSTRVNYSNTQNSGQDIRFTDSDGTTLLSYEIEKWDETGNSFVWVKVPQIDASSSSDYIYMYYGNSAASDGQSATNTWNSNYTGVWHLSEDPSGAAPQILDSTSNNRDGTSAGTMTSDDQITGNINGSIDFDGTDDTIDVGGVQSVGNFTIDFWMKPDVDITPSQTTSPVLMSKFQDGARNIKVFFSSPEWPTAGSLDGSLVFGLETNGISSRYTLYTSQTTWNSGTWYHVAWVHGTTLAETKIYVNGAADTNTEEARGTHPVGLTFLGNFLLGGGNAEFKTDYFDATYSEFKISTTARSASWIAATYKSESDTFNTFASEEPQIQTSGSLTSSIFDTEFASGASWGTLSYNATIPANTSVSVKARTSNSSSMTGATDFSTCNAITSGSDISANNCVTDTHRYIQYQLNLANTNSSSTPTFEDISIAFSESTSEVASGVELISPGDRSYTNSERPTFKWKASTDSSLSKYVFEVDNPSIGTGQPSGDFTIDNIPVSRTTDYDTPKYTIQYENFSDADSTNNYISVFTKSSLEWSSDSNTGQNDGKLREGIVSWKVKTVDNVGDETASSRTLFVDRTLPRLEFVQINSTIFTSSTFSTSDKTPTIFGKITDPIAGGDPNLIQTDNGPGVASGPKQVDIKLEKKVGTIYILHTLYTINMGVSWYECNYNEVTNNELQKCAKFLPFEFIPEQLLDYGTYKVTINGKDKADNNAIEKSFTLYITAFPRATAVEEPDTIEEEVIEEEILELPREDIEKIIEEEIEEVQITKTSEPGFFSRLFGKIVLIAKNAFYSMSSALANFFTINFSLADLIRNTIASIKMGISDIAFSVGEKTQEISDTAGFAIVKFGYLFVDEPTLITNVKVAKLTSTTATITWITNHPANGKVNWGLTEDYGQDIQSQKRVSMHEFTIENLKPDTIYYYEVMSHNKNYVYDANHTFKTPE